MSGLVGKQRICVIGAGPSGTAVLRALNQPKEKGAIIPEVVCYEKQSDWGGLWNYSWRTGLDEHGMRVHGSMYRHLWSNGPKECLEFADYYFEEHFGKAIPSFPPREVLYDYIQGRANKANVKQWVQLNTPVQVVHTMTPRVCLQLLRIIRKQNSKVSKHLIMLYVALDIFQRQMYRILMELNNLQVELCIHMIFVVRKSLKVKILLLLEQVIVQKILPLNVINMASNQ